MGSAWLGWMERRLCQGRGGKKEMDECRKQKQKLSVVQLPTPVVPAPNGGTTDPGHMDTNDP